jgi:aryl-alcohol dehydrogenase-like predicted oxidoreductase
MPDNHNVDAQRILIGTAQLCGGYGVFGQDMTWQDSLDLLHFARANGFSAFDTAPGYGGAEKALGEAFAGNAEIVTKTAYLKPEWSEASKAASIDASLDASLAALRKHTLDGLLLHTPQQFSAPVAACLNRAKDKGLVRKVGVSVYTAAEIDAVLAVWWPDIIQLPMSLLDQRLIASGHIDRLRDLGVEIHVRSVFLQGILLAEPKQIPACLSPLGPRVALLREQAGDDPAALAGLCLGFILDAVPNGKIVAGIQSPDQIRDLSAALDRARMPDGPARFAVDDPLLVNPANWQVAR